MLRFQIPLALLCLSTHAAEPLPNAHSHNDYLHVRPLLDALEQGFCSVEADIYLIDGQLLVAHDLNKVKPEKTLRKLYLDPLAERVRKHGGSVFGNRERSAFTLLIDFKSEAEPTYAVLRKELQPFTNILTRFSANGIKTNAVTIVLSGNRPFAQVASEAERYFAIDGRLPDLESNAPPALVPLISDNWTKVFQWRGVGPLSADEQSKLRSLTAKAHEQGRRIRFWAVPDQPEAWAVLREAKVDLINTDNLAGLAEYLRRAK